MKAETEAAVLEPNLETPFTLLGKQLCTQKAPVCILFTECRVMVVVVDRVLRVDIAHIRFLILLLSPEKLLVFLPECKFTLPKPSFSGVTNTARGVV